MFPQAARPRLYRQHFTPEECARLDGIDADSPLHELNLLRILLSRLLAASSKVKQTLERSTRALIAYCQAGCTMASLARIHHKQHGPPPDPLLAELAAMDEDPL